MNAIAESITPQLTTDDAVAAVRERVTELRAAETAHLADEASLTRGRERLAAAEVAVRELDQANCDAISRHAARLEKQVREGSTGPLPQLTPSDQHVVKELVARRTHSAALQMMQNLQTAGQASAAQVAAARRAVDDAIAALRAAEVHDRIWRGLELLDQFEAVFAEIFVRTEARGDSHFGDEVYDPDHAHQRLRAAWRALELRRIGLASHDGVLSVQPPLISARAALAERDAALLNQTSEKTS